MTEKVDLDSDYKLHNAIDKAIELNIKEVPYEGTEVDKYGIKESILNYLKTNNYSLLRHIK